MRPVGATRVGHCAGDFDRVEIFDERAADYFDDFSINCARVAGFFDGFVVYAANVTMLM